VSDASPHGLASAPDLDPLGLSLVAEHRQQHASPAVGFWRISRVQARTLTRPTPTSNAKIQKCLACCTIP